MMEKVKLSFGRLTVKIALVAVVFTLISPFLPWLTEGDRSQSLMQAYAEKPDYFVGFPLMIVGGVLWIGVWFLLNHPKLTLVGVLPLLLICLVMLMTASDYGLNLGIGFFIYSIAVVVSAAMAFATKKSKRGTERISKI